MKKSYLKLFVCLFLAMLGMTQQAEAAFTNFSVQLTNAKVFDTSNNKFGVKLAADGTYAATSFDDATAMFTVSSARFNDAQHGWVNCVFTVPVDGPVRVSLGDCQFGSQSGKITDAAGNVTEIKANATKKCWNPDAPGENLVQTIYKGTSATTLTIAYDGYCPFISVESVDPSQLVSDATVSFDKGEAIGVAPAAIKEEVGKVITLPKNFTMYAEGKTLTAWTDGKTSYAPGTGYRVPESDVTLTAKFTANEVSLGDRTEAVTLKWDFQRQNGAPSVQWQNTDGLVWVTQATIAGKTIDVALPFSTNPGKFANANWNDWCQLNNGTTFKVPSCKGATISIEAYNELGTGDSPLTIDGQSDYTKGKTVSYTIAGSAQNVDLVIGSEGSYYRYIQSVLPVVQSAGGETFTNADAMVEWPMLSDSGIDIDSKAVTPAAAFSTAGADYTPADAVTNIEARSKDPDNGLKFATFKADNFQMHWNVTPAAGLTFTPTQIKVYVQRFGTNKKDGVVVSASVGEGEQVTLGTYTARRANWDDAQEEGQWGEVLSNLVNEVVIDLTEEQQKALTSSEGFNVYITTGLANNKSGGFADMRIYGKVNGTKAQVDMFTLATVAAPAEGGSVNVYPKAESYEAGTEVQLTATENFGYDFVNWTNAAGKEVSKEAKFKYALNSNETLTANFKKVNTYALNLTVDGTNDYMVTVSPTPDVVDGKWMYEEGQTVVLTAAQYEGLVTFNNWSDGTTGSEISFKMDANKDVTAVYTEADIVAGWDFYLAGSNGRKADFASADNDGASLNLVNTTSGETSGWLDKSYLGGGGYESFKGAAVNWRTGSENGDVGNWHWQTKVNAEAFTDINVQFQMLYNYNAYQTYDAEYSLDGTTWTKFGSVTMNGNRVVGTFSEKLPAACNNQKDLFIRMLADKTSQVDGAASANDGNTLGMFFITGTQKAVDDGKAPAIVSTVPAEGATGASASGKIVLNFSEKVTLADDAVAYINNTQVNSNTQNPTKGTVNGKTLTFEYKGLDYGTQYSFSLSRTAVKDLFGNNPDGDITIVFTTMVRPTIEKGAYDAVVSNADELLAAITTANSRADQNKRYRIFVKKGSYTIPLYSTMKTCNGYDVPECITFITGKNISFIGEDRDATIITNGIDPNNVFAGQFGTTSKYDGIGNSDVFQISSSASGLYWQDLTIETGMADASGRDLAIHDRGTKNIYKNVGLRGYQDTWTSNNDNGLYYFEGGYLRGRTDFMCGKGDIFWNGVEIRQIKGGYASVPSKPAKIGWVYKDCVINGEAGPAKFGEADQPAESADGNYTLGRPWGSGTPVSVWIDTKMNVVPSAIGWNEMSGGYPVRFAEYNSMTKSGSQVDLSGRKKTFGDNHPNNPILTAVEAAEYSDMSKMYGDWDPTLFTEQAPVVTDVKFENNTLSWTGNNYSLLYAICKDGNVVGFTTETSIDVTTLSNNAAAAPQRASEAESWSIRAANEMGGLSEAVNINGSTGIKAVETAGKSITDGAIYTLQGVRVTNPTKGIYIVNGKKVIFK